jgi:3-oxoacyl-[acyl-carrier-protein] synthase-3
MEQTYFAGIGHYLPERVVTNFDLEKIIDTTHDWIIERTGINERRWVNKGETVTDLAYNATQVAFERTDLNPNDIDLIIFATMGADYEFPGGGCFLQERLGIPGVPAIDIRNQCSGFVFGLSIADQYIRTGMYKTILLVGVEIQSTGLDLTNKGRDIAVLFGDGAGAALLVAGDNPNRGVLSTHLHTDGRYAKKLYGEFPSNSNHPRITKEAIEAGKIYPQMEGRFVFKYAVTKFPAVIREAVEYNGLSLDDINLIFPHQANLRITEAVAKRLGISMAKVFSNIHKYGNTTAATIPICLSEAWEQDMLHDNDLIVLASFGSGFSWSSALIRW